MLALVALFGFALLGHATVIVDNTWASGTRTNWNLPAESPWYSWTSGTTAYIGAEPGSLYCTNQAGITRYFWTYFTSNAPDLMIPYMPPGSLPGSSNQNSISASSNCFYGYPVALSVGQMIQVTATFVLGDVLIASGTSPVRFGLMGYGTNDVTGAWQGRVIRDTSNITKSGTNVIGYRLDIPIFQSFANQPLLGLRSRMNIIGDANAVDPLGKASVWNFLGAGPEMTNWTGFQANTPYTLGLSVARYASSNVLTATLSGAPFTNLDTSEVATNFSYTAVDTSGSNYFAFDNFMLRVDTATVPTSLLIFKRFKVEVLPVNFPITVVDKFNSDSCRLKWNTIKGQNYEIQCKTNLADASWSSIETVTATTTTLTWTNTGLTGIGQRFYRVVNTP